MTERATKQARRGGGQPQVAPAAAAPLVPSSGAQALPAGVQKQMGSRFGHDFSQVRVFANGEAARAAQDRSAQAYTVGPNIVFGPGQFDPQGARGQHLLAHELTHVVQQARFGAPALTPQARLSVSQPGDAAAEQEAESIAGKVVAGTSRVSVKAAPGPGLARRPTDDDETPRRRQDNRSSGVGALAGPLGHAVRGEYRGAPLNPQRALQSYAPFGANDFVDSDDLRLRQINRVAGRENAAFQQQLRTGLQQQGVNGVQVGGRVKSLGSMYGKLLETPGQTIGGMKDISGLRVDIADVNQPGFVQHRQAQQAAQSTFGERYAVGKDYIAHPNPPAKGGYTGRMHDFVHGDVVPNHELQIGSRDISRFIDQHVTNASGQTRSVHDLTGYKGELYGAKVSPELQAQYPDMMRKITENNGAGRNVAQNAGLADELSTFRGNVEAGLPARFAEPPAPAVPGMTRLKALAGKGMGVLGVAGGGLQAYGGVQELREGKTAEGAANVSGGGLNMAAGGAMLAGRAALGTTLGGAAAVIDGGKDIYTGIRDGNVEKAATGGVKGLGGGLMMAGAATANPLLIGAGALTYGGALVYENREAIGKAASAGARWVGNQASAAWDGVKGVGSTIGGWFD